MPEAFFSVIRCIDHRATCSAMNDDENKGLVTLAVASLIVGAATSALGTLFRFSLERADSCGGATNSSRGDTQATNTPFSS